MSDYIPPELMPNILARLPVDDVLRCTSVCKSWYELITCPSFASLHLDLSSSNLGPRVLVEYYKDEDIFNSYYGLHRDSQTFDVIAKFDPPHHPTWEMNKSLWLIADSLNGLVCLYAQLIDHDIVLWNPSLRKSLILPKPRFLSKSVGRIQVGFGFVAKSNEYKVVRFSYRSSTLLNAEIYELSTGSWRDLKLGDHSHTDLYSEQAHYNGILHWYAESREKNNSTLSYCICTFNTKDEKFGALMLPSRVRHDDHAHFQPSIYRELLCLIDYSADKSFNIWVMKEYGVANSWQKLFFIDKERHGITGSPIFRHNGGILFVKIPETPTGGLEPEDLVSYDCNDNQVKNLELSETDNVYCIQTCVDSLVLIKAPNDAKLDEVRVHQDC